MNTRTAGGLLLGLLLGATQLPADILYSVTDLGTLGGRYSFGYGLNNAGQVVGNAADTHSEDLQPFLYTDGQMQSFNDLVGPAPKLTIYNALAINDSGQVTGLAYPSGEGFHGFLYSQGQLVDLGPHTDAYGLNNAGQVTGYSLTFDGGPRHAFLYRDGQMQDLGTLGGRSSEGHSINNAGQVVGMAFTPTVDLHAFLYQNGQIYDLNDFIDPALHITLSDAEGINDQGQIVANTGESRAYLLTPLANVPEPSMGVLCGVALLGFVAAVRQGQIGKERN